MKKGAGHSKGSSFERDISRQLSFWWTQELPEPRDDVFWRTSGSGARATTRSKKQKKTAYEYGDITFTDPIGKPLIDCFLIECKKGYTSEVNALDFFEGKSVLFQWIEKCIVEARLAGRGNWLLIVSRNRRRAIVFMNADFFADHCGWAGFPGLYLKGVMDFSFADGRKIVAVDFEHFLEWVKPIDIKERSKK